MDRDAGARAALAMATCDMVAAGDKSLGVDDETLRLVTEYGAMLKAWQRMISAIDRGFGEASFTPHRVLRLMRNCTPPDVRQVFTHLPD